MLSNSQVLAVRMSMKKLSAFSAIQLDSRKTLVIQVRNMMHNGSIKILDHRRKVSGLYQETAQSVKQKIDMTRVDRTVTLCQITTRHLWMILARKVTSINYKGTFHEVD